jgi:Flp pilus assembly protein CpaB
MGRRTIVLVIALLLAVVSGFAIWTYLSSIEDDIRADIAEVIVYRTTETIEVGTTGEEAKPLIEEGLALRESVVFEGSTVLCLGQAEHIDGDPNDVGCPENPRDLSATLDGNVAAGPIGARQVITTDQWVSPAEIADIKLSESLEQGKVALAFRPDEVSAVGGFIRPGDRINLMASTSVPINQFLAVVSDPDLRNLVLGGVFGGTTTTGSGTDEDPEVDPIAELAATLPGSFDFVQTFLQDVEVIAVGPDTLPARIPTGLTPQGAQIIVLQVTPQQAELIQYAKEYTSVSTMLLPADVPYTPFDSVGVIIDDLFTLVDRIEAQLEGTLGGTGN